MKDVSRRNKLFQKVSLVVGGELESPTAVSRRRILSKIRIILDNPSYPPHDLLVSYRSNHFFILKNVFNLAPFSEHMEMKHLE